MDPEDRREVYELARRAFHDELRAMIQDFMATVIGIALFVSGVLGGVRGALFTPEAAISAVICLLGLSMIAITWKWDRWLRRHVPSIGTARR